jgi:hypothetical protein
LTVVPARKKLRWSKSSEGVRMGERVRAGEIEFWVERHGQGPDVLLIAGLGDPAEAWQPQLDALPTAIA